MTSTKNRTQSKSQHSFNYEKLEPRCLLAAMPIVTEFMATNRSTIDDGLGRSSDWIEIYNAGDQPVDLAGYTLTDDATNSSKFVLPTETLLPDGYLVVFASGDSNIDDAGNIHTNFKLSSGGEYVGFYSPAGDLITEFGSSVADYPQQVTDVSFGLNFNGSSGEYVLNSQRYYVAPSPGAVNTPTVADFAPIISEDKFEGTAQPGQNISVTVSPVVLGGSIGNVTTHVRVNFGNETQITALDNGLAGDAVAGDGIYTTSIPSSLFAEGDLVRWRFTATAQGGIVGRGPRFADPLKSPEYFGTIVADSSVNTQLPVIHWFTANNNNISRTGTRASVFHDGEFYDNIFVRVRGQSSNNSPKKNLKFDFNPGDRFLLDPDLERVDEINLNNTYYDQADVRATLSADVFRAAGHPVPITYPVQTRRNGDFWSLSVLVEQVDADFLEHNGLDPNGALYKSTGGDGIGNNGFAQSAGLRGFEKNTRLDEGTADLQALADAVNPALPQAQRAQYLYDNVDVFSVINYLAATSIIHNADHLGKNHYVYRDTEGTGKWRFLPWDLDLTFGKNGASTPNIEVYQAAVTNQGSNDYPNSHPFFGDSDRTRFNNPDIWNRLIDAVLDTPELREMYLRRLRTVMDTILQSPSTPANDLILEARLAELLPLIQSDWTEDDARWIEAPQTDRDRGTDWGEDLPLATHFQRIIDRFLEPRRDFLYNHHNIANVGTSTNLVDVGDTAKYFAPTNTIANWNQPSFNDASWATGSKAFGYERGSGYASQIGTDLESALFQTQRHVYTRTNFVINSSADLAAISQLDLNVNYDDGFIAYLNGVEVARSAGTNGTGLNATSLSHEANGFEVFNLDAAAINALNVGNNVLAVQGINITTTSSDMLLSFSLVGSQGGNSDAVGIPNAQVGSPTILFDVNGFDANPVSGNQSQEYMRLVNPGSTAVDISGWRLAGGVELTFRPGTVIPANGELYAVADVKEFLAINTGAIGGGNSILTHGNYSGQLGVQGDTVQLISAEGAVVDTLQTPATAGNELQSFLRITEINYNPATLTGAEEFIEFTNISAGANATTLDLSGTQITDGPSTPYVFPAGTTLAAGDRLVVVKDPNAFSTEYPSVSLSQIYGPFQGGLSNSGERIRVEDGGGNELIDFDYGDSDPWPIAADGVGASLELISPATTSFDRLGKYYSWQASANVGGTPGAAAIASSDIVINEVFANSDVPNVDFIELRNNGLSAVNIGGWYLSDSSNDFNKFQIPAGTVIAAGGYIVFDEGDFNPVASTTSNFALSSSGDEVWLTSGTGGTFRFIDAVNVGATFSGVSAGRSFDGTGRILPLALRTPGAANSAPTVSPVLISEVNYNPATPSASALAIEPGLTKGDLEFIELTNTLAAPVSLADWRLRGESDFDFSNETIAANQSIVVVSFDPADPVNLNRVLAFRNHYGISGAVNLTGGSSGSLSNSFGRVSLQRADTTSSATELPFALVDELLYDDLAPWPAADGTGLSLNRVTANLNGTLSSSWTEVQPTPGSGNLQTYAPEVLATLRDNGAIARPDLIDTISYVFDADVVVNKSDLQLLNQTLVSTVNVNVASVGFTYDALTLTATWDVSSLDLEEAYFLATLSPSVRARGSDIALDGDGNQSAGGIHGQQIYVAIPGDVNLDGDVDRNDVNIIDQTNSGDAAILLANIGLTGDFSWSEGDFNADNDVDISDVNIFTREQTGDLAVLLRNLGKNVGVFQQPIVLQPVLSQPVILESSVEPILASQTPPAAVKSVPLAEPVEVLSPPAKVINLPATADLQTSISEEVADVQPAEALPLSAPRIAFFAGDGLPQFEFIPEVSVSLVMPESSPLQLTGSQKLVDDVFAEDVDSAGSDIEEAVVEDVLESHWSPIFG